MNIEKLVEKQREYFLTGATGPYPARVRALDKLMCALEKYEEALKEALFLDLHKAPSESYMAEIAMVRAEISYCRKHLKSWMKPADVRTGLANFPARSFTVAEPYGTVLIMAPWNYPVSLAARQCRRGGQLCDFKAVGLCARGFRSDPQDDYRYFSAKICGRCRRGQGGK